MAVHRQSRIPMTGMALVAVVAVAALITVVWLLLRGGAPAELADVEQECGVDDLVSLNESGSTLRFHFDGEQAARDELRCALDALGYPEEIDDSFPQGGGAVTWDGLTLVWSLTGDGRGPVAISTSS